jgi:hypothetical protein
MSGLTILMKNPNAELPVRLLRAEITIEGGNTRNYDLKTGQWKNREDNQEEGSTFVYYTLEDNMLLSSTETVLNNTPILFFPDMEQYVTLTVYREVKGEVIPFSMRLSDMKDRSGNTVNILKQGKQATLLLSVEIEQPERPVELFVERYVLQDWITTINPPVTITFKIEKIFRIEVEIQRNGVPDIKTCKKISSINLEGSDHSYRVSLKPPTEEGSAVLTNTLRNLPEREDITAYQLIVYLNDGTSKEVPIWKYNYHYAVKEWDNSTENLLINVIERSLIIKIEGDALD